MLLGLASKQQFNDSNNPDDNVIQTFNNAFTLLFAKLVVTLEIYYLVEKAIAFLSKKGRQREIRPHQNY